jgi:hypothetical protein
VVSNICKVRVGVEEMFCTFKQMVCRGTLNENLCLPDIKNEVCIFLKTDTRMEMSLRTVDSFSMMLTSSAYARPLISRNFPNMRPQRCRVTRQNTINSGQSPCSPPVLQ